ncbi:MAG: hypothetical protein KAH86_05980, partial [Methanosarcinales archaeon]|nr:hypothetical protein [Methanosarcinales archaeon]
MPYESKNDWSYNTGYESGGGLGANGDAWINAGRSDICAACHSGYNKNENTLDMNPSTSSTADANGDSINDNDRPSCGWAQGTDAEGSWTVRPGCHVGGTDLDQAPLKNSTAYLVDWEWKANGAGGSKSHSHNSSGALPCEVCHSGHQIQQLPNSTGSTLQDQCDYCHDRSDGWINISSDVVHTSPGDCANCHIFNNKLNSHLVPVGAFGGTWCLDCHNLTGTSPINRKVDPAIVNISNPEYIHDHLNEDSDATNSSRICWACHTNDSYVINGIVNSTVLPDSVHPTGYETPKNCTDCHYNTSIYNFGAPQNARHTWYAPNMTTPAVTSCADCHAQDEMLNTWTEAVYPPNSDNEAASHYGKNRSSFFASLTSGQYCSYCHQNESTVMGPFANPNNVVRSDHASQVTTPGCGDVICHNEGKLHEDSLVIPKFNESNIVNTCLACHSPSNYSNHNNTLTCWDCHMGNVSEDNPTWIHPIQFIQSNGNFTGAKLTGATCYDCHKSTNVDSAILNLSGTVPPKVNSQSHSNDPNNGTIWGDYWDYTPTSYEFATYYVGSGNITPAYPFDNIMVPSNDFMELAEVETGSANNPVTFPYTKEEQNIDG